MSFVNVSAWPLLPLAGEFRLEEEFVSEAVSCQGCSLYLKVISTVKNSKNVLANLYLIFILLIKIAILLLNKGIPAGGFAMHIKSGF